MSGDQNGKKKASDQTEKNITTEETEAEVSQVVENKNEEKVEEKTAKDEQPEEAEKEDLPPEKPKLNPLQLKAKSMAWLKENIMAIASESHIHSVDEVLRSSVLADRWYITEEGEVREAIKQIIIAKWKLEGWWDNPPGKSSVKAKAIYDYKKEAPES